MEPLRLLRRYLALPAEERRLCLRAFVSLATTDLALRLLGFRRLVGRTETLGTRSEREVSAEELARARQYARWLETASRHHFVRARCLHRSLALHCWLREAGLPSELRIGVRKEDDTLRAHAWVELAGRVVDDWPAAVTSFTPLASLDGVQLTLERDACGPAAGRWARVASRRDRSC